MIMIKRLFPSRWARIVAWTGAALAWGTSLVAIQAVAAESATDEAPTPVTQPPADEVVAAAVPAMPDTGLTILRYSPVAPPPPAVITKTVVVAAAVPSSGGSTSGGSSAGGSSGGGSVGTTGGSGTSPAPPPPPPAPAPAPAPAPPTTMPPTAGS